MQRSKPLAALQRRRTQVSTIHSMATEHSSWVIRLAAKYGMPRAQFIALMDKAPGALEYEIAALISDVALAKAQLIIKERGDWPDGYSPDLFERATYGHWRRLRDQEMAQAAGRLAETRALLNGERIVVKD